MNSKKEVANFKFYHADHRNVGHAEQYWNSIIGNYKYSPFSQKLLKFHKQTKILGLKEEGCEYDISDQDSRERFIKTYLNKPATADGKTLLQRYENQIKNQFAFKNGVDIIVDNTNGKLVGIVGNEIEELSFVKVAKNSFSQKIQHMSLLIHLTPDYQGRGLGKEIIKISAKNIVKNANEFSNTATYETTTLNSNARSDAVQGQIGLKNVANNLVVDDMSTHRKGQTKNLVSQAKLLLASESAKDCCNAFTDKLKSVFCFKR